VKAVNQGGKAPSFGGKIALLRNTKKEGPPRAKTKKLPISKRINVSPRGKKTL